MFKKRYQTFDGLYKGLSLIDDSFKPVKEEFQKE